MNDKSTNHHKEINNKIFKKGSITYYNASRFFPKDKREDIATLYAFVRVYDDFVDVKPHQHDKFDEFVTDYLASKSQKDININMKKLAQKYDFDPQWTLAFIKSIGIDKDTVRIKDQDELWEYIYGSAEVIGLYMQRILDLPEHNDEFAMLQGRAYQLINFIRDIGEDLTIDRIYMPQDLMDKHHIDELSESWLNSSNENKVNFENFIKEIISIYDRTQSQAYLAYPEIPYRYRIAIKTATDLYNWTSKQIAKDPSIVFKKQIKPKQIQVIARGFLNAIIELF